MMGRPRKDGRPSAAPQRIGRPRASATGGRPWRVRAYAPTAGAPFGRVVFRDPTSGRPTSRVPVDGQDLDELFESVERALDQQVALSPATTAPDGTAVVRRDIRALGELYLTRLATLGRDPGYISPTGAHC